MAIKTIRTKDFFGEPADFEIIWETVCMTFTFAVGIQTDRQNEFSIFRVTNMDGKDIYHTLDTGFLDVYYKYDFSVVEKVKKEMKKVITRVLTTQLKSGTITIEQIEKMALTQLLTNLR